MSTIHASTVTRSGTSSVKAAPTGPGAVTVSGSVEGVMVDEPKAKGRFTRPICDLVVGRQVTAVDARHKLTRCLHDRRRQGQATQLT